MLVETSYEVYAASRPNARHPLEYFARRCRTENFFVSPEGLRLDGT